MRPCWARAPLEKFLLLRAEPPCVAPASAGVFWTGPRGPLRPSATCRRAAALLATQQRPACTRCHAPSRAVFPGSRSPWRASLPAVGASPGVHWETRPGRRCVDRPRLCDAGEAEPDGSGDLPLLPSGSVAPQRAAWRSEEQTVSGCRTATAWDPTAPLLIHFPPINPVLYLTVWNWYVHPYPLGDNSWPPRSHTV